MRVDAMLSPEDKIIENVTVELNKVNKAIITKVSRLSFRQLSKAYES